MPKKTVTFLWTGSGLRSPDKLKELAVARAVLVKGSVTTG
jgi:hypothetical protein